jgi:exopolysaccharide production protein ExoQ
MSATMSPVSVWPASQSTEEGDPLLFSHSRTWWTIIVLCFFSGGITWFAKQDSTYYTRTVTERYSHSIVYPLATLVTWVITGTLMAGHIAPTMRALLKQKPLLAVAAYAMVSSVWSDHAFGSFRQGIMLLVCFAFGAFLATYYSPTDQRRIILAAGTIMAVASLTWVLLLPAYGIASAGEVVGEWKGVYTQKNILAVEMVAFFSVLPFRRIHSYRQLRTVVLQALLPLLLVFKSHSREALIIAAMYLFIRACGPFVASSRKERLPFIIYLGVLVPLGIFFSWDTVLSLIPGALTSWSGRLKEWGAVVPFIDQHFWIGYGYQAFWTGEGDSLKVIHATHAALMGSDSGYTDNMLSFGLLGMLIISTAFLGAIRDFMKLLRRPSIPIMGYWYIGFILTTLAEAVVGNAFPLAGFYTILFAVSCCGLTSLRSDSDGYAGTLPTTHPN